MALIESMSGKVCQDSDVSFRIRNGKIFTAKLCHPFTGQPSDKQLQLQQKFQRITAETTRIIKMGPGSDDYDLLSIEFANQKKYPTLRGFIFARLWEQE